MKPPDIWLLFGLPVTKGEFLSRLSAAEESNPSDYLAKFDDPDLTWSERIKHHDTQWLSHYAESVADPLQRLAQKAESLGVYVRQGARMADLAAAAAAARVIVLFSHWKGPEFVSDDFSVGLDDVFEERIKEQTTPVAMWLKSAVSPKQPRRWLARQTPMTPRSALYQCIGAQIRAVKPEGIAETHELSTTTAASRREAVDQWLAGYVRPGNRLELFDGLHDKREIAAALENFTGILDLTVCVSTFLGDYLGAATKHRFRTVQFLAPQDPAESCFRLGLTLTIAVTVEGQNYLVARQLAAKVLPSLIEEEVLNRGMRNI